MGKLRLRNTRGLSLSKLHSYLVVRPGFESGSSFLSPHPPFPHPHPGMEPRPTPMLAKPSTTEAVSHQITQPGLQPTLQPPMPLSLILPASTSPVARAPSLCTSSLRDPHGMTLPSLNGGHLLLKQSLLSREPVCSSVRRSVTPIPGHAIMWVDRALALNLDGFTNTHRACVAGRLSVSTRGTHGDINRTF